MKPSVGRIVHYMSYGTPGGEFTSVCRAAVITEIYDGTEETALSVVNPTGLFFNTHIRHDENKAPGTWHWPERVDG